MSVALVMDGCDEPAEILRIVEIELDEKVTPAGTVRVSVTCDGASAKLRVDDAGTSVSRDVVLDASKGRARLIALAAVELLSTSASERITVAAPEPAVLARVAPPAMPFRMIAFGGGIVFGDTGFLGGGGVRVLRDGAPIGWLADVQAHHGTTGVSRGSVTTDLIDVTGAVAANKTWSRLHLTLAIGARGGAARLAGDSSDMMVRTDKFWSPWFGAVGLGSLDLRATSHVAVNLTVDAGYVVRPVGGLVDARREIGIDGAWMGVHLGIGTIL